MYILLIFKNHLWISIYVYIYIYMYPRGGIMSRSINLRSTLLRTIRAQIPVKCIYIYICDKHIYFSTYRYVYHYIIYIHEFFLLSLFLYRSLRSLSLYPSCFISLFLSFSISCSLSYPFPHFFCLERERSKHVYQYMKIFLYIYMTI